MIELDDRGLPPFMFGLKRRVGDRHQDCPDLGAVGKKNFPNYDYKDRHQKASDCPILKEVNENTIYCFGLGL